MTYQVLARKWRPQDFSSLVGQGPIVTALRNGLREGRIAQAYLFSGIRGVGKTTAARVLAKALNCDKGPAADPCNQCIACIEITRGSDLDVLEVDAATYSKVEQVRELTESLKYGPARDRYKVVVLDEVHRLSRQAFDALLKIVEEPPPFLVFIFATTEIDAVPATILSRCQEFHFRRVPSQELTALLHRICGEEGIAASDTALRLVARAGEGSVRDSVALLDQLATFGSGTVADEDAVRLLGGLDTALFHRLLAAIVAGDAAAVRDQARRVDEEGWDPRHVFAQFLAFARDALHLALGAKPEQIDLPREEAVALAELAAESGYENLLRLVHLLLASEPLVRRSDLGVLAAEIAWLRAAELPKLTQVESLLRGGDGSTSAPSPRAQPTAARPMSPPVAHSKGGAAGEAAAAPAAGAPGARTAATTETTDAAEGEPAATAPEGAPAPPRPAAPPATRRAPAASPAPATSAASAAKASPARSAPPGDPTRAFLEEISKRKSTLAGLLDSAEALSFADGSLTIVAPAGDLFFSSRLSQEANRSLLEEALAAVWGPGTTWRLAQGKERPQTAANELPLAGSGAIADNPTVQTMLDIFGGRVETVEEHEG
jgi:DNA polymerase-3 subunit gamma/tau